MAGVAKYPVLNPFAAFVDAPDAVYGTGADGTAILDGTTTVLGMTPSASVYTMTRDLYFYNLTLNTSVRLNPAGYRIFVENILTLSNASTIGFTTGFSTAGSIQQGGAAITSVTNSLGGNATATYTATAPTAAQGGVQYWYQPRQAVLGYSVTAAGGITFLRGGAGSTAQAGGGIVILAARYISCTATSTNAKIAAPATSPAGGGVVMVVSTAPSLPTNVSTDVTGANAGTYVYMQLV